jgi:imidazolonepropionase-like amidohydrolase
MNKRVYLSGLLIGLLAPFAGMTQPTFPVNGVADPRDGYYAFVKATVVKDAQTTLTNATVVVRDGRIISVTSGGAAPKEAIVIDCDGKYIYPSFIDIFSSYGLPAPQRPTGGGFFGPTQLTSNQKGAYGWNQALRTDVQAYKLFTADDAKAKPLRDIGFGTVMTHQNDGIAQGTGTVVTLLNEKENLIMLKDKAAAHYSFNKGSSGQSYPSSLMGSISLLRQTYLDARWYKSNPSAEGVNISLKYFNDSQSLPQIFDANEKWNVLRADRIGDEFGVQYIIKGGGKEYQRMAEMKATKAAFILPLNFPAPMDVDDPNEVRFVGLDELKHWELAPSNPAEFEKAGITFCLTTAELSNVSDFSANVRKAIEYGLTEAGALNSLTKNPATLLGIYDKVGSVEAGKLANFLITSGPIFKESTTILHNWIQGRKVGIKEENWTDVRGTYSLTTRSSSGSTSYNMELKRNGDATFISKDTSSGRYTFDGKLIKMNFTQGRGPNARTTHLSGVPGMTWSGRGTDPSGNAFTWTATLKSKAAPFDSAATKEPLQLGKVVYPFLAYGSETLPKQETLLIRNATVWTNEAEGKLLNADVLIKNGKIAAVGKGLSDPAARVIDGTGKHVTAGIIDEHSHIAAESINEGGQSVTSEVRIADNLDPDDIQIYRQLSGGVTSSHILHGSANTIGGQTQLIKLRWGGNDGQLKFQGADGFIKFALGENVKRSSSTQGNVRFPDTRMGVEQVLVDAFTRARDYENALKAAEANNKVKGATPIVLRRDLELDALVEIMNKKRFITCHSYVQSEINAMMKVGDRFGFTVNTFTHILEGYKVADKMKAHGASASSFADWWAYKMEVIDAIPYSPTIMTKVGLNVGINSDDAEMARRLNQEAAKSLKYGGLTEEEALKMVTLNPAKMLHVDKQVGSIKVGKDADIVVWSDNPLSIYAKAEKTIVDGTVYFDRERDAELRKQVQEEKARLVKKLIAAKRAAGMRGGMNFTRPRPRLEKMNTCFDHVHDHGLLVVDGDETESQN